MNEETPKIEKTGARFEGRLIPNMGVFIAAEGPGKGFASYPWALDRYERALGITPEETWLLHRMMKHYWKAGGEVNISMRKVCDDALLSRATLDKIIKSLLKKGYITVIGRGKTIIDRRVRYDISGVFNALMMAISCDPASKYCKVNPCGMVGNWFHNAPADWMNFSTPAMLNHWCNARGQRFNWAEGRIEPLETNSNGEAYQATCSRCGENFLSGSPNANHCPACRENIRLERWRAFQRAYDEFENTMEGE